VKGTELPPLLNCRSAALTAAFTWLCRVPWLLLLYLTLAPLSLAADLPPIVANPNHAPAGVLRDGILSIQLEIAMGEWHPESDDGIALSVYAFGETGRPLQNPGPLIRVAQGTEIRASVRNRLNLPITVHGLAAPGSSDAGMRIPPGEGRQITFTATTPGLYFYWGASEAESLNLRYGIDAQLTGALVVDPIGSKRDDEIFVMQMMSERPGLRARQTLATINGKSWPFTQRFQYNAGQKVHWRWINATNEPHALHLHGAYYRIDGTNRGGRVQRYDNDSGPLVVTQRIAQGETFDMSWSPERPGNWLFHCHMIQHMIPAVVPKVPGLSMTTPPETNAHAAAHEASGMGQLVLGITVPDRSKVPIAAWHAERRLQLEIRERAESPRYTLLVRDNPQAEAYPAKPGLIGPPIVLTRGQRVEIEVVNRLKEPTAIHWHGIELESYYDGVPGWSGSGTEITPPIAPGTSFVARMAPPRAGTFIYHTHWHDETQLTNGLYGPLIVLPPGEKLDPARDLTFVFSIGDFGQLGELALINGTPQSKPIRLRTNVKYRFRFINISTNNQAMQVSLRNADGLVQWSKLAKDGVDLPPSEVHLEKAQLPVTVGETCDVEFSTDTVQDLVLDLLMPGQKMQTSQTLSFVAATRAQ
jgi:FtsP/CotA-like multicopper oxidase with cupredoxin domain